MKYPEELIPVEEQYDVAMQGFREEIDELLVETHNDTGDILMAEHEFARDPVRMCYVSELLAKILKDETEDLDSVRTAVYRGACFGLQIAGAIENEPVSSVGEQTIFNVEDGMFMRDALHEEEVAYLARRPHLDQLIQDYMAILEPTRSMRYYAEMGAALMLMMVERQKGQMYLEQ